MLHDIFNNFEKMISNLDSQIISLKNQIMSDDPKILPTLCVSTGRHLSSWQWSTGRVNKLRWTRSTGRHLSSWQWSTGRGRVNRLSSSFLLQVKQIHKSLNDKF